MHPKVTNSTPSAQTVSSSGLGDGGKIYGISSTKSGELLPDDSQLLELKSKNQRCTVRTAGNHNVNDALTKVY